MDRDSSEVLTTKEVCAYLKIHPVTLYRIIKRDSTFPQPLSYKHHCKVYSSDAVRNWLANK